MNPSHDLRQQYWDEQYMKYWQQRVAEANEVVDNKSRLNQQDSATLSDRTYLEAIEHLNIAPDETVLELGCGFGRSLPFLSRHARQVWGLDISSAMVEAARQHCAGLENVRLEVGIGEQMPFQSGMFNAIICFGVFDAMYQTETIREMCRVAAQGCRILLTGKNVDYWDDDEAALIAEDRARQKGHPNYFTRVHELLAQLDQVGLMTRLQRFYSRRGDFHAGKFHESLPPQFYEYMLVFEKVRSADDTLTHDVSQPFSKTWLRRNGETG
ncbi:MAG: methyltransferase domain-containing protein [Nitrospira sp.]|nr:methyltransferase domain-containing protein [Nitrospira sp.]